MKFQLSTAEIYIPDGLPVEQALARTTHLCIAAHQDDIEIMAASPILDCFQQNDFWFTGVVVTDGRGSPREDLYKDYSDEEMRIVRFKEQKKAATIGEYSAQILLDFPSKVVKNASNSGPQTDLKVLLETARPRYVYTHNLADKHDTHVAVSLRVVEAIRSLPKADRPEKLYGCEVWRDLDWMADEDKIAFDLTKHESLQTALLGVFDSQICGGKRYDLASMGRRRANATYFASHGVDLSTGLSYGMDLTPLIIDTNKEVIEYVLEYIQRLSADVSARLERCGGAAA
jgi:LmbE family N-acetylglucosaminyl deacetylase